MSHISIRAGLTIAPVVPAAPTALAPLGLREAWITGGFWARRQSVNRSATLRHCEEWMVRVGWLGNFDAVATGTIAEVRQGREFSDSEIYKLLEALAWQYATENHPELDARIRALTDRVARAQADDGYIGTKFGSEGQAARYSDMEWGHELYNVGHLLQAAVARLRSGCDDGLVEIARRAADHVCEAFGAEGRQTVCGHPEIELGLVEFSRATGDERYLRQAQLFLERRGTGTLAEIEWGPSYFQDDTPIRDADVLRGHAVRALYLTAAAVDVAVDTGDAELLRIIERQWTATVARRTYLTGGMGSHHQDEAFGEDFELPADRAYCETCAGVASMMLSWRLLLATGDVRYADLIERTLYNILAVSPSPEGTAFFYANTLHRRTPSAPSAEDEASPRASSGMRAPWFEVSCCPTNLARTFASLGAYLATTTATGVQIHQYASAEISTSIESGPVRLHLRTDYPVNGAIEVTIDESPADEWDLQLRVPAWAGGATVVVSGERTPVTPGAFTIRRVFTAGDVVRLELPIEPRWTFPDSRIDATRGTVAIERGPVVYCLESVDLPNDANVDQFVVAAGIGPREGASGVEIEGYIEQT
ncbi:MAG: beta-L-arabinofuranosidase domain-containing protein, partial [Mycetocola sp.]